MKLFYKLRSKFCIFANTKLGWRLTRRSLDRVWLEIWVMRNCEYKRTMSVGTAWYTMHLPELVEGGWVTVDVTSQSVAVASTSDKHYVIDLSLKGTDLGLYNCFDNVILNGVLGKWGVKDSVAATEMLRKLCRYLKPGGNLLIGYNDNEEGISYDIDPCVPGHMRKLHKTLANSDEHSMHTYIQYKKPEDKLS